MSKLNLDALDKLCEEAPCPPWRFTADDCVEGFDADSQEWGWICDTHTSGASGAGAFIAAARSEMPKLIAEVRRLEKVLEDFRDHGTRHDVMPTIMVRAKSLFGLRDLGPPRTRGWYGYVKEMDDYVREKARAALEVKDA